MQSNNVSQSVRSRLECCQERLRAIVNKFHQEDGETKIRPSYTAYIAIRPRVEATQLLIEAGLNGQEMLSDIGGQMVPVTVVGIEMAVATFESKLKKASGRLVAVSDAA